MQEQRYWVHAEKFNGLKGNFLAFIHELAKETEAQMLKIREGTRYWKVMERSMKYLLLIYIYILGSKKEIDESKAVMNFRDAIREIPLPAPVKRTTVKSDGITVPFETSARVTRQTEDGHFVTIEVTSDI